MIQKIMKKGFGLFLFSKRWDSNPRTIDTAPNFSIIDTGRRTIGPQDRRLKPLSATLAFVSIFNEINNSLRTVGFEPTHQKITGLKSVALNHSAISALVTVLEVSQLLYLLFPYFQRQFLRLNCWLETWLFLQNNQTVSTIFGEFAV